MPVLANSFALLVKITRYENIRPLPAVRDGEDLEKHLRDPAFAGYQEVELLTEASATQDAIRAGFAKLLQKTDADSTVFVYFSGHGGQIARGAHQGEYLLPVGTVYPSDADLARTAISGREFSEFLGKLPARKVVVVLDCCHSGGIGEPRTLSAVPLDPGISDGYLDQLAQTGGGRVIYSACDRNEVAITPTGSDYGLFTKHLLEGLKGGVPSDDGYVRVFDLFEYLYPRVTQEWPTQHPVFKCRLRDNFAISCYPRGQKNPPPRDSEGFPFHAFVSYAPADRTWVVQTLLPLLKKAGLRVALAGKTGEPGVPYLVNTERALEQSKRIVLVLTPAYLADGRAEHQHIYGAMQGMERGEYRLLPIQLSSLEGVAVPGWIGNLTMLDMTDAAGADEELARLVASLNKPLPHRGTM